MELPLILPQKMRAHFPFTGKHLMLGGKYAYHYIDEGQGDPVLFLHGNPTWSFYFRHLLKALKKDHRVVAPDHLGCGLSSKPQNYPYRLQDHIENLKVLVDTLNLKNITLVVHDWGGAIGLGYATKFPQNIKKMVILNSAAFFSPDMPWRIAICKLPYVGEWVIRQLNGFALPATYMAVVKKMPQEIQKIYLYPYNNYQNRVAIHQFVKDIPRGPEHPTFSVLSRIESQLPLIKCPKLILWGGKDFCFHQGFLAKWRQIYQDAEVKVFPSAGHYVLEDAREETTEAIQKFVC